MGQSDESCPKCSKQGLSYYTMQLRSADEGSTVFYEVSLLLQFLAGADDSVSNAGTNTLKTIRSQTHNVVIYTKCIIHISSNYNHQY
jgi:hypothetical protein